jgi:hypothetical protein
MMRRSGLIRVLVIGSLALTVFLAFASSRSGAPAGDKEAKGGKSMVYEMRTYVTHPGRLPALHKRFREHTLRLFEKHGMKNVAYWTPTDQENTLIYVIAHKSVEASKKSWQSFRDDPDWKKAFEASHKDGPIVAKVVSQFMETTDYSPLK